jgi:hypothetical protein
MDGRVGPPSPEVTESELDGTVCLYSPALNEVLVLNETASDVWRLADGEQSLADIVGVLAHSYGVPADSIHDDVVQLVRQFRESGLLADASA